MNDHKEGCDCCVDIRRAEQELAHLQPEEASPWQTMETAPTDGTPFLAICKWPSRIESGVYRWEGAPNYWHNKKGGVCIRPAYQERHLWCALPADYIA